MRKTPRKLLAFWICAAVGAVSLLAAIALGVIFGASVPVILLALLPLGIAFWAAYLMLSYKVFSSSHNSSIYRSGDNRPDPPATEP